MKCALTDLLLVPLEDTVVFPGMTVTLTVDVGDEDRVAARAASRERVRRRRHRRRGHRSRPHAAAAATPSALEGLHRGVIGAAHTDALGRLRAEVEERPDENPPPVQTRELEREYRAVVEEILELRGADDRIREFLRAITEAGALADTCAYAPDITLRAARRAARDGRRRRAARSSPSRSSASGSPSCRCARRIRDDVEDGAQKQQREWFLRQQMDSIRKELGEDEGSVVEEYRAKIDEAGMPDDVRAQAERELRRLETMGDASGEASMIRTYLDWLIAVPWSKRCEETLDPQGAREVLDADHAGLEDVKDRIVEYLAVRKLRQDRGIPNDKRSGAILTLIGPPGTGKTSIGESVARALNREFVRMSLGGIRDEAEIRGHRRTYIGALPGRLVRALRDAGTMNPVILLDEVDKVGADWRGDPSAALLEVLDPAQNHSFRDHYLDVELDLSEVFFIATANVADTIPGPLLDRMEVIRFDGYTVDEKMAIARGYLWPRQRRAERAARGRGLDLGRRRSSSSSPSTRARRASASSSASSGRCCARPRRGSPPGQVEAPVAVDVDVVRDALGRQKFFQEAAERTAVPGVATGLAVTGTGGDVLFVEATSMDGANGELVLTGQLGDVMKESARIALSYVQLARRASSGSSTTRSRTGRSTCTSRRARSRRTGRAPGSR